MARTTTLELHEHHRTADAILASETGDRRHAVWLPLSKIEITTGPRNIRTVELPEWLAIEKGLA